MDSFVCSFSFIPFTGAFKKSKNNWTCSIPHRRKKVRSALKLNSYGIQLISPETVGLFFTRTRLRTSLKCLDIKPQYVLNEKLICDENDPKFLHFAKVQLLMSLFIPYLCPLWEIWVWISFKSWFLQHVLFHNNQTALAGVPKWVDDGLFMDVKWYNYHTFFK